MHLLHRLYGVDAAGLMYALQMMKIIAAVQSVSASTHKVPRLLIPVMTQMMMMMMMMGSVLGGQPKCPSPSCTCYGSEVVDCRSRSLTMVPTFQPGNVTYDKVLLSDNYIRNVRASAFRGIRFHKLEITNNPLRSVDDTAFSGLESTLAEVVLEFNSERSEFPHGALRSLVNLTVLKVAGYASSRLPPGALDSLRTLRELRLTPGNLETLAAVDVMGQRSSLKILDISDNKLREFPTDAIRALSGLRLLNVRANLIDRLGGHSVVSSTLEELDISHHALDRAGINSSAFDGVASTLRRLVMSQCHLEDRHVPAIARAAAVTELVVPFNHITNVRTFLADMPDLERVDAQNNSVDVLTSVSLPPGRRLRALNLAYNPLTKVQPDAFSELRLLEDLKLDFARAAMPLDSRTFASQRSTLRSLSLRGVDLSRPQWSVIGDLERLEMVSLSRCRLGNIPPFTFRNSGGRLHTLKLAGNHIDELSQRAFVGLESSLVRLDLDGNRLTTMDRCTFYRFTKLDPKSLILRGNALECDCGLEWLYNWTEGSRFFLNWRCADGKLFSGLTDDDFQRCNKSTDAQPCEDFTLTTPSTDVRPRISLFLVNVTPASFAVRWTVDTSKLPAFSAGFRLNCSCADTWVSVNLTVREHRFDALTSGKAYQVCVMLEYQEDSWTDDVVNCLDVRTSAWLTDAAVMSAVIISAVLVLLVLPLTLAVCLTIRRCRRRRRIRLAELAQPKITAGKTKRFLRQQQPRPESLQGLTNNRRFQSRSVENNLDTLQDADAADDDRYRTLLAIRLLQSRSKARSLDDLLDGVNAAPSYAMNQLYAYRDKAEQEVYDEINEAEVDGCKSPLATENTDV